MTSSRILFTLCYFLYVTLQGAQANNWWMNEPYGNDGFNMRVEFGHNVTLECNDTFLDPGYDVLYWILPDLKAMRPGDPPISFFTLDGDAGWVVDNFTGNLHIFILQESQFGFYHCIMEDPSTQEIHVVKKAVNFKGPYFGALWPKYRMNTIYGGGAAGGFLVLAIIFLVTCKFHYKDDDDEDDDEKKDDASSISSKSSNSSAASSIQKYVINDDAEEGTSGSSSSSSDLNMKKRNGGPQGFTNEAYDGLENGDAIIGNMYASINDDTTAL